jgi:hypothetical protein
VCSQNYTLEEPAMSPLSVPTPRGPRRPRLRRQAGAQSLEWIGLGSFVVSAMTAASVWADHNAGGGLGALLLHHLQSLLGQ